MNKKTKSQQSKKKLTRNILIGVLAALVIAAVIFLVVVLQKDSAGMNCFQRNAIAATADGVKASMGEYRMSFDSMQTVQLYKAYGISVGNSLKNIQEDAAQTALMQKIYIKEGKAMGFTLTKEEQETCKKNAQEYVANTEEQIKNQMITEGSYSKSQFDKQLSSFYKNIGMNRNAYIEYIREGMEAELYGQKIYDRLTAENTLEGDALVAYYRENVEKSMYTEKEDGTKEPAYEEGQFWKKLDAYRTDNSSPMMYLPEGYTLIDLVKLEGKTAEEAEEIITQVNAGTLNFEELKTSPDNKDAFLEKVEGPYPIWEKDHKELFDSDEMYQQAVSLEKGKLGAFLQKKTAEDGTETSTVYIFRIADGSIVMDGTNIINIDWFTGLRESTQNGYLSTKWSELVDKWLADVQYNDAIYTYNGGLK